MERIKSFVSIGNNFDEIIKKFNLKTYFALVFMEATSSYLQDLEEAFEEQNLKDQTIQPS